MSEVDITYIVLGMGSAVAFFVLFFIYDRRRKPQERYRYGQTSVRRDLGFGEAERDNPATRDEGD